MSHFMNRWEGDETLQLLLRAATTNQGAVERMQSIFAGQLVPVIAALHPPGTEPLEIATRAGLAASQVLGLAPCRYVLRLPPMVAMDRQAILTWVAPTVQRYRRPVSLLTTCQ